MTHSVDSASPSALTTGTVARAWLVTLAAGLAAAIFTSVAGESLMIEEIGTLSKRTREIISPVVHRTRNGMTSLGLLGGSLGLGLGLAGGLLRSSPRSAVLAGLLGVVLGVAAGAGAAKALVPVYFSNYSGVSLGVPLLVHGGLWTSISVAAGLAFGLGFGGRGRAVDTTAYAIAGALLATFTCEFAGVWLFPAAQTDRPLPISPESRMFTYLVVALLTAAAVAFSVSRRQFSNLTPTPTIS
jgi:hypothetical protein